MAFAAVVRIAAAGPIDVPCYYLAEELTKLSKGRMVMWQPETSHGPAMARFRFDTEHERDEFVVAASQISRVSIASN